MRVTAQGRCHLLVSAPNRRERADSAFAILAPNREAICAQFAVGTAAALLERMDELRWQRTKVELRRRHAHLRDFGLSVRFVLLFAELRVGTHVRAIDEHLLVTAECAVAGALEPEEALRCNAHLHEESIALAGGVYVVRSVVDANCTGDALEARVQRTARAAALIKSSLRRPSTPISFAYCGD